MGSSEGSAPAREAAGSSVLKKGLELYAQEDYEAAAKLFQKAISSCSCQIHGGMLLDSNEDILTGIENNQLKEVLSTLTPRSKRCDKQVHIRALDSLIATYEMLFKLDKCLNLAVGMVNLAPREPKVYLRLGKILRLKSKQTLAYHMYRQGIELVERKNPDHSLLPKLRAQRDRVATLAAFDPITKFPIELVRMTFEFLDFKTLCRCLRVSKAWNNILTKSNTLRDLWHVQTYKLTQRTHPGIRRMLPTFKAYNKYGKNALRELSIDGLSHFLQWCKFSQVMEISQQLKVLKLREPRGSFELESLPPKLRLPQLINLSLGYGVRPRPQVLEQLITACGSSLEELSVFELPHCARVASDQVPWYPGWVKLEKLKVVRLAYPNYELRVDPVPNLRGIIELAPNVEEAWIDNLTYSSKLLMAKWPKLQNIFIGNCARLCTGVGEGDVEGGYNEHMRELHFEGRSVQSRFILPQLRRLERLSILLHTPLTTSEFETIVRPSIESGTLRELDIRPFPVHMLFGSLFKIVIPDWFRSESLTYLSITGLTVENLCQYKQCDEGLLTLVSRFPNLRSIDISNEQFSDALLAKFIQRGVKIIYHRAKQSKADLQEWAATHYNAQVISRPPPHLPSMHPDRQRFFNDHLQFSNTELP
ncbi:hypothetical protein F4813DRAFT_360641 [Daldinia decipiens]|uniref:uncharacterized protein n=1 Tax=Daldinia decipiens TaxID=326647 RepID=UPI0020C30002|nr:uncharacterized protein F4813DRAFT_360641 [Daldinia decipiens]KAI1657202.1 hypothetical protein F4813DRAFT_360641 [Daldinia decipiens]